jgi:uncharacterized membrane protein
MTTDTLSNRVQSTQATRAGCCCAPMRCGSESVRDILDRRLASGELTKEQYEEIRRQLEESV